MERITLEAVTHKGTLGKLLDLMSKANIFEPRVKPLINFEDAGSSGSIYKRLVEDMGTVVADTGILGHVPLWELTKLKRMTYEAVTYLVCDWSG